MATTLQNNSSREAAVSCQMSRNGTMLAAFHSSPESRPRKLSGRSRVRKMCARRPDLPGEGHRPMGPESTAASTIQSVRLRNLPAHSLQSKGYICLLSVMKPHLQWEILLDYNSPYRSNQLAKVTLLRYLGAELFQKNQMAIS